MNECVVNETSGHTNSRQFVGYHLSHCGLNTCPRMALSPSRWSGEEAASLSETARACYVSRLRLMKKDEDAIQIYSTWESLLVSTTYNQ